MSAKGLERKIEGIKQEINNLETELTQKRAYLLGFQEALKFYPKDSTDSNRGETVLRHGSDMAHTRDFLLEHGRPAHITEILEGIGKENTKGNRTSLSGSLSNYARRRDIFARTAPNTFTLISLNATPEQGQPTPSENFGVEFEENGDDNEIIQ